MKLLGRPFEIQNTAEHGWIVTWNHAVIVSNSAGELIESVSLIASVPRSGTLTIPEVQQFAVMRAIEMLKQLLQKAD